jgi:hypothetical protein
VAEHLREAQKFNEPLLDKWDGSFLSTQLFYRFESPPLPNRMNAGLPKKLLTFSAKYGDDRVSKSA